MNAVEKWLDYEIPIWIKSGNTIKRLENGFSTDYMKVVWDEHLYFLLKEAFSDCAFLHCYHTNNHKFITYVDFSFDYCSVFRFYFFIENNLLKWTIKARSEKDTYSDYFFKFIEKEMFENLIKKIEIILVTIKNLQHYRIKLSVGNLALSANRLGEPFCNAAKKYDVSIDHINVS